MAGTPWTLQSTKRRQSTTTPAARKQVRISDDVDRRKPVSWRSKDQKTLTQIQWIASPSVESENVADLEEVDSNRGKHTRSAKAKRRSGDGDSTLTQMDWLGGDHLRDYERVEDASKLVPELTSRTSTVSQADGIQDEPPRRKRRRSSSVHKDWHGQSVESVEYETQEYVPPSRTKHKFSVLQDSRNRRRKSERIASRVPTGVTEDTNHANQSPSHPNKPLASPRLPHQPVLEIQDSIKGKEEPIMHRTQRAPQTPPRQEIPSSQTPESTLKRRHTYQRKLDDIPKSFGRKPLQEITGNARIMSHDQIKEDSKSRQERSQSSPVRSKICVLKLPKQALRGLDIPQTDQAVETVLTSQRRRSGNDKLLSSPCMLAKNSDLPKSDSMSLLPCSASKISTDEEAKDNADPGQENENASMAVQDFGRPDLSQQGINDLKATANATDVIGEVDDTMLLDHEIVDEDDEDDRDDDDSVFGPRITNDTQFNAALIERTSSPNLRSPIDKAMLYGSSQQVPSRATPSEVELDQMNMSTEADKEAQLQQTEIAVLIPRLVERPPSTLSQIQLSGTNDNDRNIDLPALESISDLRRTRASAPSSDATQSSPSSPSLPSFKTPTLRSIKPASMPHPSQISTQDPTQNYPLSYFHPATQLPGEADNITIKDSSLVRLSQVPQYMSQSQQLKLQPVDESDDELDELDLDPSSAIQLRQSARKRLELMRKETGSSLKSIHPPSDSSGSHKGVSNLSSSPTLPHLRRQSDDIDRTQGPAEAEARVKAEPKISTNFTKPTPLPSQSEQTSSTHDLVIDSDATTITITSPFSSIPSSPPSSLNTKHDPILGFDNDTQSNFTSDGYITAAYIRRQRKTGAWPDWFVPEPFQVADWRDRTPQTGRRK